MLDAQADIKPALVRVQLYNFGKGKLDVLLMELALSAEGRRYELAHDGSSVTVELRDTDVVGVARAQIQAIVDDALASNETAATPNTS